VEQEARCELIALALRHILERYPGGRERLQVAVDRPSTDLAE
jgi:hypothetical protein